MVALIDISDNCYQEITHNCTANALTNFSWWVDRFGNNVTYWNGDRHIRAKGCQCRENGSCDTGDVEERTLCNCDARDDANVDFGVLSSRDQLPVMELAYGDSQNRYSWIHYILGRFTCERKRWIYPSEIYDNDFAVKIGFTSVGGPDVNLTTITSRYNLHFDQTIYDRSLGSWKRDTFTAPVDGFYTFHLKLQFYTTYDYVSNSDHNVSYRIFLNKETEYGTTIGKTTFWPLTGVGRLHQISTYRFKLYYLGDQIGENGQIGKTKTYTDNQHTPHYISEIYLKKGEQAYYYINNVGDRNHHLNYYTDCETLETTHSCTWLEIKKTGD